MNKTKIEWADYTWNPIKGLCPLGCEYCYARKLYKRFNLDPTIRLDKKELFAPLKLKKPSRIFVGSTIEVYFKQQIPYKWISSIIALSYDTPQHTYLTLTKLPLTLEGIEFPEWWWVGVTITFGERRDYVLTKIIDLRDNIKFISFEPLLGDGGHYVNLENIDWVIIGSQTQPLKLPNKEWVEYIIDKADEQNIPIFLKNNLKPLLGENLRQEFPSSILTNRPILGDKN